MTEDNAKKQDAGFSSLTAIQVKIEDLLYGDDNKTVPLHIMLNGVISQLYQASETKEEFERLIDKLRHQSIRGDVLDEMYQRYGKRKARKFIDDIFALPDKFPVPSQEEADENTPIPANSAER